MVHDEVQDVLAPRHVGVQRGHGTVEARGDPTHRELRQTVLVHGLESGDGDPRGVSPRTVTNGMTDIAVRHTIFEPNGTVLGSISVICEKDPS